MANMYRKYFPPSISTGPGSSFPSYSRRPHPSLRRAGAGRRYYKHEPYKPVTMNDLPVPRGSWHQHYAAKQRNYNLTLAGGLAFFGFTVFTVSTRLAGLWPSAPRRGLGAGMSMFVFNVLEVEQCCDNCISNASLMKVDFHGLDVGMCLSYF